MLCNIVIIKQDRKEGTWYATSNQLPIIKTNYYLFSFFYKQI